MSRERGYMTWSSTRKNQFITPPGYRLLQEGRREILVRDGYEDRLHHQGLLDPAGLWEQSPHHARIMGRGEILIVRGKEDVAVRKYRHGGLLRRLTGDLFFFGSRPFQEVTITERMRSSGVPTLEVLAAVVERGWGGWYRGYLITRFLPAATDLISYLERQSEGERRRAVIEKAAEAVRKMHQGGIYHADLHLKNFLVEEGQGIKIYLIDFDRSKVYAHLNPSLRMKNVKRLDRSAEKFRDRGLPIGEKDKKTFCRAYAAGDNEIRPFIRSYLEGYRWYRLLYRWGWWIAKILYPRQGPLRKSAT